MGVHANDASAAAVPSEGGVKYRLVEAEEVDGSKQQQQQAPRSAASAAAPTSTTKPKGAWQALSSPASNGKLNWSQFPLDGEVASDKPSEDSSSSDYRPRSTRGRGRGGRFGGGRGGGRGPRRYAPQQDSNGTYINGVYVPNTDPKLTAEWAKGQIEFYFSPGNLVRDMFLRQHMDVDGFVPLAFVGSFQAVFAVHQDYPSLLEAVKNSTTLELDEENEKIRLRENWKQWLWPNADGTLGVPRYIKLKDGDDVEASN